MTFTPKVWTNGTLVDAIAMIDLETRLGAYSDTAPNIASARRDLAKNTALGYYAETAPRSAMVAGQALISGTVYYMSVGLLAGDVVTNLYTLLNTAASGFSGIGMKLGLYDKTGVLLRSTGDVSGSYGVANMITNALSSAYTILTTDLYYVGILAIATTPPALVRSATGFQLGVQVSGFNRSNGHQLTQTDLPATATMIVTAATQLFYWVGIG